MTEIELREKLKLTILKWENIRSILVYLLMKHDITLCFIISTFQLLASRRGSTVVGYDTC